jgi:predicted GNAT family acetyltransferase
MSEFSAIRNAIRAERQLIQGEKAAARTTPNLADVVPMRPPNVVKTATGKQVDISRGYNVKGPDGLKIPFSVNTPLDKAKVWTKNFYRKENEFEFTQTKALNHEGPQMRDKADPNSYINFAQDKDSYQIKMSFTPASKRGQGVGAGMYRVLFDKAQKEGMKVRSDTAMSQASVDVWLRFKQLGYPIKESPRKKLSNGGYENAKDPDAPLFEFDPSQKEAMGKPTVRDPVAEIDKNKPHMKVGTEVRQADEADQLIYNLRRQTGVPAEQREKILDTYNDYKMAETPEAKQELATQLKAMMPTEKAQ